MAYDFDMPIIRNLLRLQEDKSVQPLPLLSEQSAISEQPPQEPQEQIGGTDMVNKAVASAIPQAPNPYALNIQRGLLTDAETSLQ